MYLSEYFVIELKCNCKMKIDRIHYCIVFCYDCQLLRIEMKSEVKLDGCRIKVHAVMDFFFFSNILNITSLTRLKVQTSCTPSALVL